MSILRRLWKAEVSRAQVQEAVADYLAGLPDEKAASLIARIIGAQGLTEATVRRMVESVKGERVIEIHFGNGDTAIISNRPWSQKAGPGW